MTINYTDPQLNLYCPLIFEERWKYVSDMSVPNVKPGAYLISTYGRVYSNINNQIMKPLVNQYGYIEYYFQLTDRVKKRVRMLAHRVVAIEFNPIPNYKEFDINHLDGNKSNPCLWNLQWATDSMNIRHAVDTGLKPILSGEDSSAAIISNEQAEQICKLIMDPAHLSDGEISKIVGCTRANVYNIRYGRAWRPLAFKYGIIDKPYINKARILFTNEDIHKICKYFEDNKYNYFNMTELFAAMLQDLYGLDKSYLESVRKTLTRYYKHEARRDITDLYDY